MYIGPWQVPNPSTCIPVCLPWCPLCPVPASFMLPVWCVPMLQELALGKALKQRGAHPQHLTSDVFGSASAGTALTSTTPILSASSASPRPTQSPEELAQFVSAFKEMASTLDEDGARNLLLWSPLFMPTVEGLMISGSQGRGRGSRTRLKAAMPHEAKHPAPITRPSAAAAQREAHLAKLQAMYAHGSGGSGESLVGQGIGPAAVGSEASTHPSVEHHGGVKSPGSRCLDECNASVVIPVTHAASRAGSHPQSSGSGAEFDPAADDWEEEVDDLLNWTTSLSAPEI